jgi:hypothetical protein
MVTGSARLNVYRRGGDSLQGRYHYYRLHPFSCAEAEGGSREIQAPPARLEFGSSGASQLDALLHFGGFPEPFLLQSNRKLRRWQNERLDRFFREDIRDLTLVQDLGSMRLLSEMLSDRAAQALSINSLSEDLQVSPRAIG